MVLETSVSFIHLTLLIAREYFIEGPTSLKYELNERILLVRALRNT
jgi:hypothetical protein